VQSFVSTGALQSLQGIIRSKKQSSPVSLLFFITVALPTLLAIFYYGVIASNQYVSQAKFIVRGVSGRQAGGLEALFRTFGVSKAEDDTFAVHNYISSRDAVKALDAQYSLRDIYGGLSPDIFSHYPYFWRSDTFEALFEYYQRRVEVWSQTSSGMSILEVTAFTPEDAQKLSKALLGLSEALINRMNERANSDALTYAQNAVSRAETLVIGTQKKLTAFRNSELILDPSADSLKTLELVGQLTAELAQTRLQLDETLQGAPSNPAIQGLRSRISSIEREIAVERSKVVGRDDGLASKVAAYERLILDREFADRTLSGSFNTLETARQEARRQQLYIETVVSPNLPDESTQPRRGRSILTVFTIGMALFGMAWLVMAGSREHLHG